jgi:hypothetical protein
VDVHQLKLGNPADQHGVDVEVAEIQHAQLSVNENDLKIYQNQDLLNLTATNDGICNLGSLVINSINLQSNQN